MIPILLNRLLLISISTLGSSVFAESLTEKLSGIWEHAGQYCSLADRKDTYNFKIAIESEGSFSFEVNIDETCTLKKSGRIQNPQLGVNLTTACLSNIESLGTCPSAVIDHVKILKSQESQCFESYFIPSQDMKSLVIIEPSTLDRSYCPKGENLIQNFTRSN